MFNFLRSRPVPEIECTEAFEKAQRKDVHLVDVREPHEWQQMHVDGAISMPLSQFDVAQLPADRPLAFLCLSGRRSAGAARQALAAGRTCSNVAGGLTAWRMSGLPMRV